MNRIDTKTFLYELIIKGACLKILHYILLFSISCVAMDAPLKRLAVGAPCGTDKLSKEALMEALVQQSKVGLQSAQDPIIKELYTETLHPSNTWNTLTYVNNLPEHQLWSCALETEDKKTRFFRYRFDNDITHDCNEFWLPCNEKNTIAFDGPNNDGRSANGVIMVGHSYENEGIPETVFYLFKQHGVNVKEYAGVQKKVSVGRSDQEAIRYEGFPFSIAPLRGHTLTHVALAGKQRGLIGTCDRNGKHHLSVFDYTYKPNATDTTEPDHTFDIEYIAYDTNAPDFKKLGWIYGKTLLGITQDNQLYIIALDLPATPSGWGSLRFIKQKTAHKFIDFAIGRPDEQHEIVLIDEHNRIFHMNLKQIGMHGNLSGPFSLDQIDNDCKTWAKNQKDFWLTTVETDKIYEPHLYRGKIGIQRLFSSMLYSQMCFRRTYINEFASFVHADVNAEQIRKLVTFLSAKEKIKSEKKEKRARKK